MSEERQYVPVRKSEAPHPGARVTAPYISSVASQLNAEFRRINSLTSHATSIGAYHEGILRRTIGGLLPGRYSVKTGFVHDGGDRVSRGRN